MVSWTPWVLGRERPIYLSDIYDSTEKTVTNPDIRVIDNRKVTTALVVAPESASAVEPVQAMAVLGLRKKKPPKEISLDHIAAKIELYNESERQYNEMAVYLAALKAQIAEEMGDAQVARVNGVKVFTRMPKASYRTAELLKDEDWGDLARTYVKPVSKYELDMASFAKDHPGVAALFQTVEFRRVTGKGAIG